MKNTYGFWLNNAIENYGVVPLSNMKEIKLSRQSFSGTDTRKEKDKTGIVYPFDVNEQINGFVTASSIIDHHNSDRHLLKRTEVRKCSNDGEQLLYQKIHNTCHIVLHEDEERSDAIIMALSNKQYDCSVYTDECNNALMLNVMLMEQYKDFNPLVIVSEKNLEKKVYEQELFSIDELDK